MRRIFLAAAVAALSWMPAAAMETAGREIVVPIVGRGPGALGSEWRTDLVLTHVARRTIEPPAVVTLTLWQAGQAEKSVAFTLEPRGSMTLEDVLLRTFGIGEGSGMLSVSTPAVHSTVAARARIYNVGSPAGDFGQIVNGLPLPQLALDQLLPALSAAGGRRTNIGVTNPTAAPVSVWISLHGPEGDQFGLSFGVIVPPRTVKRWDDIISASGLTLRDPVTVRVAATAPVYAFASTVSGQSGDADFISGTAVPADEP
ncbi:MAG TPA: hypothetical protein VEA38_25790 [Terriglobales bacterium]|nr:hypothetical protein [Terriglobales bacterium]